MKTTLLIVLLSTVCAVQAQGYGSAVRDNIICEDIGKLGVRYFNMTPEKREEFKGSSKRDTSDMIGKAVYNMIDSVDRGYVTTEKDVYMLGWADCKDGFALERKW